jgi:L-lactate dehydrogenase
MEAARGTKIVIVGAGMVGSTTAFTLLLRGRVTELVLIDYNKEKAFGDALDMNHAMPFIGKTTVRAGDYEDCAGADIIIIAAGAAQKPGETRLDLLKKNVGIFEGIVDNIVKYTKDAILLVATNPVDIMSYFTWKRSGYPMNRVVGSGTLLDTARLRYLISEQKNMDPRSVHAHIVGEHGDSELALWSLTNLAGMHLEFTEEEQHQLHEDTKNAAYGIIKAKGSTYYAIALALDRIVTAILRDEGAILNVSTLLEDFHGNNDVYLGVPCIVDRTGVREVIKVPMNDDEKQRFSASAKKMREQLDSIEQFM